MEELQLRWFVHTEEADHFYYWERENGIMVFLVAACVVIVPSVKAWVVLLVGGVGFTCCL